LLAFVLLAAEPFMVGLVHPLFAHHRHLTPRNGSSIVISLTVWILVLVALAALVNQQLWAWIILVLIYVPWVVVDVVNFNGAVGFSLVLIRSALLVSPPICRYVGVIKRRAG
jgi:hypothetical protein